MCAILFSPRRRRKSQERGKVVVSHPLGRDFVSRLKAVDDTVVPHDLPERHELERLVQVGGREGLSVCIRSFLPFTLPCRVKSGT